MDTKDIEAIFVSFMGTLGIPCNLHQIFKDVSEVN